jgi:hypothetical protein
MKSINHPPSKQPKKPVPLPSPTSTGPEPPTAPALPAASSTALVPAGDAKRQWQQRSLTAAVSTGNPFDLISHTLNSHRNKERQIASAIKHHPRNPLGTVQGLAEMVLFIASILFTLQQLL